MLVWCSPNVLTVMGLVASLPGFYWLSQGRPGWGALFLVGGVFDVLDGSVARLTGKVTKFGGVFDATMDRISDGLLLLALGMGGFVPMWLAFLTYIVSVSVSYVKAKAETMAKVSSVGRNTFSVGVAERGERVGIIFGSLVLSWWMGGRIDVVAGGVWLVLVLSVVTLVWRGVVIWRELGGVGK